MDFRFTDEQEFFRAQVRDAVDRLVRPRVAEIDARAEFPRDLWDEFARLGYFGLRHPEQYGGMGADTVTSMIFFEELARGACGFFMAVTVQMLMGTYFLGRFGSEAVRERVLVPAIRGEKIAAICFTESQSGSDLGGTRTSAVRDGDGWVLRGTKEWITNGPICDFATVVATTDPPAGLKGLSFFLVEQGMPGFSRGKPIGKLGAHGSVTGEVVLENVRVPGDHLLGEPGKGVSYLGDILNQVRVMTGLAACSIAQEAMRDAREYARRREAFGKTIAEYQLIREKFARFWATREAARTLLYRAAWMIDEKLDCLREAMAAKWLASEMCLRAVDDATRIYAGNAFSTEYPPERFFRDARFLLSGGGTHEVLLDYLGRAYLKEQG
ncbi:MAG: acyl-CoA dehydrogenase family protein [Deltaproteobacteria bacterium]|nr:acyl-CoA dehydrogenase family protein [Deltaproteobacteria bacterium]